MRGAAAASGAAAEARAAQHLERQGLEIRTRNYRCRGGEIDLIAVDGDTLVFVEVRLRSRSDYGGAAASIDSAKQRRLLLAARHYLGNTPDRRCRFDVVLIAGERLEWIRDAFGA